MEQSDNHLLNIQETESVVENNIQYPIHFPSICIPRVFTHIDKKQIFDGLILHTHLKSVNV